MIESIRADKVTSMVNLGILKVCLQAEGTSAPARLCAPVAGSDRAGSGQGMNMTVRTSDLLSPASEVAMTSMARGLSQGMIVRSTANLPVTSGVTRFPLTLTVASGEVIPTTLKVSEPTTISPDGDMTSRVKGAKVAVGANVGLGVGDAKGAMVGVGVGTGVGVKVGVCVGLGGRHRCSGGSGRVGGPGRVRGPEGCNCHRGWVSQHRGGWGEGG